MDRDVAREMIRTIARTKFDDLPEEAVRATKQHLLHALATAIGGSSAPGCETVVDLVKGWGGHGKSTILVYGGKVPAVNAALANAVMSNALVFCANDDRVLYKADVIAIPSALAIAEHRGGVTGKALITAILFGVDLGIRIALAINPKPAHAIFSEIGPFAGAIAAGKILELNEEQLLDALGLAYCQVCGSGLNTGTRISTSSPSLSMRLGAGAAARNSVFSALLAQKSYHSNREVLQGPEGYFCFHHGEEGDLEGLIGDFGKRFQISYPGPTYPLCRYVANAAEAALLLAREHDIGAEDVDAVTIYDSAQNTPDHQLHTNAEILARKRHPRGQVDAQFSPHWVVAAAIVKRGIFIDEFTEEGIKDPEINKLADKVTQVADPKLDDPNRAVTASIVEIRTKRGKVFSKRVDFPKGSPQNPYSMKETEDIFRRCVAYAARPLAKEKVEEALNLVYNLEQVDDVGKLCRLLGT